MPWKKQKIYIYLVKQTQPEADIYDKTIYAFVCKSDALDCSRILNKKYGKGCVFDKNGDFTKVCWDNQDDNYHYFKVEPMILTTERIKGSKL